MITTDYFINDINLPSQNLENIQSWINKYEKEILIKSLGYSLYTEFINGLAEPIIAQKWLDLRDGKEFEYNGITVKWNGFLNSDKESMLAYYIFSEYVNHLSQSVGTAGVYKLLSENSEGVSPIYMVVDSWNKAKKIQYDNRNSLYNFLNENSDIYENWTFEKLENKNIFNI